MLGGGKGVFQPPPPKIFFRQEYLNRERVKVRLYCKNNMGKCK